MRYDMFKIYHIFFILLIYYFFFFISGKSKCFNLFLLETRLRITGKSTVSWTCPAFVRQQLDLIKIFDIDMVNFE